MNNCAIRVENISKRYRLGTVRGQYDTLRDTIMAAAKAPFRRFRWLSGRHGSDEETLWALNDISFEVKEGEVLGIIGRNGAGKSTLLKILSRITRPTSGRAELYGRVGSLLEVGTGFHPELTGRENIYLNGAVLGMRKAEIDRQFDGIIDFAGIEPFLDTPVKRYSSGMYVRLAFSVAAHLDTEILLVDEVLAVGDAEFQLKCLGKMQDVRQAGRTILFVSHNMTSLASICTKGMVLSSGEIAFSGSIKDAVDHYIRSLRFGKGRVEYNNFSGGNLWIKSIGLLDSAGSISEVFSVSAPLRIVLDYEILKPLKRVQILCHIWTLKRAHVLATADIDCTPRLLHTRPAGRYRAEVVIPANLLAPGQYYIQIACGVPNLELLDVRDGPVFEVTGAGSYAERWSRARQDVLLSVPLKWDVITDSAQVQEVGDDRGL